VRNSILEFPARDRANDSSTHTIDYLWKESVDYTGCPRRYVPNFGRVFLMLNYTDITQNIYV